MLAIPARVIATCLALVGFAGAVVVGIAAGNEPSAVLLRATLVMIGCLVLGTVVGHIAQRTIDQHVEQHKRKNPIPGQDEATDATAEAMTADPRSPRAAKAA